MYNNLSVQIKQSLDDDIPSLFLGYINSLVPAAKLNSFNRKIINKVIDLHVPIVDVLR